MTPQELETLKQLVSNHEANAANSDVAYANANPTPAAKIESASAPYEAQAKTYNDQANVLDQQAQSQYPRPTTTREHVVAALRAGMENFGRLGAPGGYSGQEAQRQKDFAAANDKRVEQAKTLRGEAAQQQQLGLTAQQRQQTENFQNESLDETRRLRTVEEQKANAPTYTTTPQGSITQGFDRNGAPIDGARVEGAPKPVATKNEGVRKRREKVGDEFHEFYDYFDQSDPGTVTHSVDGGPEKATASSNGAPASPEVVHYFAQEIGRDANNWTLISGNKALSDQVRAELAGDKPSLNKTTASTRQLGETAVQLLPHFDDVMKMLNDPKFDKELGPGSGRWNEFMAGKVGAGDPDFTELRSAIGMLQTGTMRAHVGARGGQALLDKFAGLMASNKMDAATLRASLKGIRPFMEGYAEAIVTDRSKDQKQNNFISPGGPIDQLLKRQPAGAKK